MCEHRLNEYTSVKRIESGGFIQQTPCQFCGLNEYTSVKRIESRSLADQIRTEHMSLNEYTSVKRIERMLREGLSYDRVVSMNTPQLRGLKGAGI